MSEVPPANFQPTQSPPPEPSRPRRSGRRVLRWLGLGCLGMLALVLLCGVLAAGGYRLEVSRAARDARVVAEQMAEAPRSPGDDCAPARPAALGESERILDSAGLQRRYLLYVPESYDPARQSPLVITLHGSGASPEQQRDLSQWNAFADAHGFLVAYPAAADETNRTFVSFPVSDLAVPAPPNLDNLLDVRFLGDLVNGLQSELCIDATRVYVTGFSAGGAMAIFAGCRLPGLFAAAGTVAAPYWANFDDPAWCSPGRSLPTIAFHGTADRVIPYDGGGPQFGPEYVPYETWTARWAARNGCASPAESFIVSEVVDGVRFTGCDGGADVVRYRIEGGGHTWPGGAALLLAETTREIAATAAMWAFFNAEAER